MIKRIDIVILVCFFKRRFEIFNVFFNAYALKFVECILKKKCLALWGILRVKKQLFCKLGSVRSPVRFAKVLFFCVVGEFYFRFFTSGLRCPPTLRTTDGACCQPVCCACGTGCQQTHVSGWG